MTDVFSGKNRQICSAAANIQQNRTQFFFFLRKNRFTRCKRLQHNIKYIQPGTVGAFNDIMCGCHSSGDDVNFSLKPDPCHSYRILNSGLVIHNEFLRQHMNDFTIHGNRNRPCSINNPFNIALADLRPLNGDNSTAVKSGDMAAGNTSIYRGYFTARHEFSFFNSFLDGLHSRLDIDNDPFSKTNGRMGADPDNVDLASGNLPDDCTYLGCSDIKANNNILLLRHVKSPLNFYEISGLTTTRFL